MTILMLLTPHAGGLGYDLQQNSYCSAKDGKVCMSTADTANLFGKI
jgi:hypothetical protein